MKKMGKKGYKKLQFKFSEDAIERLDKLKIATAASSRTEVVRNALRVYEYMNTMINEGYELELQKDGNRISVVPLPL